MKTFLLSNIEKSDRSELEKGVFIVMLHAGRIPPHIGILAGGLYHSLSIKGRDLDVGFEVLMKSIVQRKIPSLFIQIRPHDMLSPAQISSEFKSEVLGFTRVDIGMATCLSPLKLFFARHWLLQTENVNYIYELLPLLEQEGLLGRNYECNMETLLEEQTFNLPYYTMTEINRGIEGVRTEYN
jgi:hypothetical protein